MTTCCSAAYHGFLPIHEQCHSQLKDKYWLLDLQIVTETIPALQKLRDQGLVRAIGITGLPLDIYPYVVDK